MTETKTSGRAEKAIDSIGQFDGLRAFDFPADHPAIKHWLDPQNGLVYRIARALEEQGTHAARAVVVLPYAQLLNLAQRMWCRAFPDGFTPRFETTRNWAAQAGSPPAGPTDVTLNVALDSLTARCLAAQAGGEATDALCDLVVEAAHALAPLVAGMEPSDRGPWTNQARAACTAIPLPLALSVESRATRIALEWAAQSGYATDVLYDNGVPGDIEAIVLVEGLTPDPLFQGLHQAWTHRCIRLPLLHRAPDLVDHDMGSVHWHACADAEDEAQLGCALILRHIAEGRYPLALASSDRALTRRMRAMLEHAGAAIRDETGWKLSTTRAAAHTMALLEAAHWMASTDTVLAVLKAAPAWREDAEAIERLARTQPAPLWHRVRGQQAFGEARLQETLSGVDRLRAMLQGVRPLTQWLGLFQEALNLSGFSSSLSDDVAGRAVQQALYLDGPTDSLMASDGSLWSSVAMDLVEFSAWVNRSLEQATFQLPYPDNEQVVILPMSQTLARPFAAAVLAGCDEVRLSASPEPGGPWSPSQRDALGLPGREDIARAIQSAWSHALQTPHCDVVWRTSDAAGEPLLASPLVQLAQRTQRELNHGSAPQAAADPRLVRRVEHEAQGKPMPIGAALEVTSLSASAYESLRQCPYRFFALRQLGLSPVEELESELDKRDFGLWLHAVLEHFHVALAGSSDVPAASLSGMLDESSNQVSRQMGLEADEFLPYMAAWPAVRDGYLTWWALHQADGATFETGEVNLRQRVGEVNLRGRVDRIDRLPQGVPLVIDYKTESLSKTNARVKVPLEDTQLAFYAALLPDDDMRAAYLNVSERDGTEMVEQKNLLMARDALRQGMEADVQKIRDGFPMPALGDGPACNYCDARGLCRKDFWSAG